MQPIDPRPRRPDPAGRPAVFLDRDGTLIEDAHYLVDPRHVRLLPGTVESLRRLRDAGFACVVVTNQSAIGRGMLTEEGLRLIHEELARQLAARGVALDAFYHCPEAPTGGDPTAVEHPDRKPGPGMLLRRRRFKPGSGRILDDRRRDQRRPGRPQCRLSRLDPRPDGPEA